MKEDIRQSSEHIKELKNFLLYNLRVIQLVEISVLIINESVCEENIYYELKNETSYKPR